MRELGAATAVQLARAVRQAHAGGAGSRASLSCMNCFPIPLARRLRAEGAAQMDFERYCLGGLSAAATAVHLGLPTTQDSCGDVVV